MTAVLLVIVALGLSGVAKLMSPAAVAEAFVQLRIPKPLSGRAIQRLFPYGEFALALCLLLLPAPFSVVFAAAAVALMAGYTVVIARALTFDVDVSCACFGTWTEDQVTRRTLARNVLLLLAAIGALVWAVLRPGSVAGALIAAPATTWGWLLGAGLVAATVWCAVGGARREEAAAGGTAAAGSTRGAGAAGVGDEQLDSEPMQDYVREPIPYTYLLRGDKSAVPLRELAEKQAKLLFFLSPTCGSCHALLQDVPQLRERLGDIVGIELISWGPGLGVDLQDPDRAVAKIFGFKHAPAAILLGVDGFLAGGPVEGLADVRAFVDDIAEQIAAAG